MTSPPPTRSWAPNPAFVALAGALAVVVLVLLLMSPDAPSRVMLGLAVALLGWMSLQGALVRPKLAVDETGLTVRGLRREHHMAWHEVKVRLQSTRRLGRVVRTLELDWERGEDERLVVLTQLDLGADPQDVAEVLHALRP
ncbi:MULTISPECIES: PH domain-containing protein [Actinosynnema]|uniref:Low molecular weight protein antigen 6 PH domain-containing protein n=3 Tax=Actinosynnema TaxID=40566 RepID=C6WCG8_ACTMD|nr:MULTISPECIES: PH domain-containing protein [Actinosynnema]ACU33989.1 hypothetical protein Amir_0015 [Actinosynnema mirum DSM 43827]ATE51878.1 hypothetical protein CNX65_00080 [Actinosynnema pretiosum]AXX27380.1 membrane protein [Actinosynnema pretiosum subsp. pretiosum]